MQTNSPDSYTVTCSPRLMTDAELAHAISLAESKLSGHPLSQPGPYAVYDSLMQEKNERQAAHKRNGSR